MPKQNQANEAQQDKKNRPKLQPLALSPDLTSEKAGLPLLPESLLVAGANSIEAQAARLEDSRLQTAQRQAMAGQIGQTQGNLHLQRVVAAFKPDHRATASSPESSKSSSSPLLKKSASPTIVRQAESAEAPGGDELLGEFLGGSGLPSMAPPPPPSDKNGQKMSVQRDGTALPPIPNVTLTTPSLLQPPDPASRYRLGGEQALHFDPETQAMMQRYVQQQLDPGNLRGALSQIQLGSLLTAPAGTSTTPASPGAGGSTPTVPAGAGPATPRAATPGDLMGAVLAVPAIDTAINHLQSQALDQVNRDWRNLGTGGQVVVVSSLAVIGLGALGGAMSDPAARQLLVDQLNGRTVPVPGLNWMRLEVNTSADNLMVGMHVDVGQLLPASWGFKSSSPSAIGGPPTPQPAVAGQRTAADESGETAPSEDIGSRIQAKAGGGRSLDEGVQRRLESGLGADMSNVRVHTDHEADELSQSVNAVAFTTGQDIFFREGTYNPNSTDGLKLLAHEATHTVQQSSGPVAGTPTASGVSVSDPGDRFERAAEVSAEAVVQPQINDEAMTHGGVNAPDSSAGNTPVQPSVQRSMDETRSGSGTINFIQRQDHEPNSTKAPADGSYLFYQGHFLSTNPEQIYDVLAEVVMEKDLEAALDFVKSFDAALQNKYASGITTPDNADPDLGQKINLILVTQGARLELYQERLIISFGSTAQNHTRILLKESKAIIEKEQERYGLEDVALDENPEPHSEVASENSQTGALVVAATELATQKAEVMRLRVELEPLEPNEKSRSEGYDEETVRKREEVRKQLEEAERAYHVLRSQKEAEFPILAAYSEDDPAGLAKIAESPAAAASTIGPLIAQKLENIQKVSDGLDGGQFKVWKQDTIMKGAKALAGIAEGSLQNKLIDDHAKKVVSDEVLGNLAVGAIAIALGLIAAIPTAGASVGVALATVAAATGGAVLAGVQVGKALQEYELEQAANGTAFDKAKAISQEEPSLFWLALDIVGAIFDIRAAFTAFKSVGPAFKALSSTGELTDFAKAAKSAMPGKDTSKLVAYAARRPEVAEAITRNIRTAGDALRFEATLVEGAIREVKRILGPELTKVLDVMSQQKRISVLSEQGLMDILQDASEVQRLVHEQGVLKNLGYYAAEQRHVFVKPGGMGHLQFVILHESTHHAQLVKLGRRYASFKNEFQALYMESQLASKIAGEFGIDAVPREFRNLVDLSHDEIAELAKKLNPELSDAELIANFDAQKAVEEILAALRTF